jgi:phosphoglycerol transferase MdoB-like AlkP superfamily enzyme
MNKNGEFSLVESPVYGGRTAQAEFELLTGIKALAKVDSIEFNVMMGDYASSFVQRLKKLNYRAVATIASSSVYFNEKRAYKSLGFNEVSFLAEEDAFKDRGDHDHPIFDADVFQYNLKKIRSLLIDRKGPLFNYVVGLYGHIPYVKVDEHRDVIITSRSESNINKISNQFYYRTKALADYLDEIRKIDPDSITVIVSDHIPPVLSKGSVEYKFDKKINIAIVRNSGKNFPVSGKKYFQIPWLIWSFLSKTNNDIHIDDQVMEEIYFKLLSETIHDDD